MSGPPQSHQPSDDEIRRQQAEAEAMKQKALGYVIRCRGKAKTYECKDGQARACFSCGKLSIKCSYYWKIK